MPQLLPGRTWIAWAALLLAASAALLFISLGHYPLWTDEADTALYARGIRLTGDTSAVLGHNLYAVRAGTSLVNLRGRYEPPLPFYFLALFISADETRSLPARLPFAVCGLLTVVVIVAWMRLAQASRLMWCLLSIALLGNVSFFLFSRQARYYSLAMLLSVLAAFLYLRWEGRRRWLSAFSVVSLLLLATHYLAYAALFATLGLDYALFRRHERRLNWRDWSIILVPQIVAGLVLVSIWNPHGKGVNPEYPDRNILLDKLTLLWWHLRDLNTCEFCPWVVLVAAPMLYLFFRNAWLLRAWMGVLIYTVTVVAFTPQPVAITTFADIRYLSALLPLCLLLTALCIFEVARGRWWLALPIALVACGSNVLHKPWAPADWRSTPYEWWRELAAERETATSAVIRVAKSSMKAGDSVWVIPAHLTYPLMYHAPELTYAWQLRHPPEPQFRGLPEIHFAGKVPPDYIVGFGSKLRSDERYPLYETLDIYADDRIRPELVWRSFQPVTDFDRATQSVYIYKRKPGSN